LESCEGEGREEDKAPVVVGEKWLYYNFDGREKINAVQKLVSFVLPACACLLALNLQ
jgi:hypothetical protein